MFVIIVVTFPKLFILSRPEAPKLLNENTERNKKRWMSPKRDSRETLELATFVSTQKAETVATNRYDDRHWNSSRREEKKTIFNMPGISGISSVNGALLQLFPRLIEL